MHLRAAAAGMGMELAGLQLFERSDRYLWGVPAEVPGVRNLKLSTAGNDRLRWRDAGVFFEALRSLRPDVVVVNGWGPRDAILAHFWCRWNRKPRVLVSESLDRGADRSALMEFIKREIIRGVGSALVAGAPQRRYAQALGVDPAAIRLGCAVVDNAHFGRARSLRTGSGRRVLTVARWSPEKNLLAAARAFHEFARHRPGTEQWVWTLAGYGPLARELEELAEGCAGHIRLIGAKSYAEMPAVFAEADLYWQPSVREPWGLVVNEAMAAGLPVLVSKYCGCHEDLVVAGIGWVFDPDAESAMVQALECAAQRHEHWSQMGEAAARHVRQWDLPRFSSGLIEAVQLAVGAERRA
jgi:glycosyltransferase involved in cell wall biosynthesis